MNKITPTKMIALVIALAFGVLHSTTAGELTTKELALLGHRNMIVVADSAYPLQSHPSIETRYIGGDQLERVVEVLQKIEAAEHVSPIVMIDAELDFIPESAAAGITAFRNGLERALEGIEVRALPHMEIIRRLDETADLFNILILKTDALLPYTSVFIELDAGYWDEAREQALRSAMEQAASE